MIALRRRQVEPHVCSDVILWDASASSVLNSRIGLRFGIALVGGEAIPLYCLGIILWDALAFGVIIPMMP